MIPNLCFLLNFYQIWIKCNAGWAPGSKKLEQNRFFTMSKQPVQLLEYKSQHNNVHKEILRNHWSWTHLHLYNL